MKKCFFVTPIGDDNSETRKNSDDVLEFLLQPVCEDLGFKVIRVDQINSVDKINETIINELRNSELVIVDMTFHNPNVFYEFGFRHALGKPLIPIIRKDSSEIPFDVATLRTIFYSLEARPLEEAKNKLKDTIDAFGNFDELASEKNIRSIEPNIEMSLLNINDRLDDILESIKQRNIEDISIISEQVAKFANPKEDVETAVMKELLPKLIENPTLLNEFIKLQEKLPRQ
ncbi:hypothetical protein P0E63_08975 [Enterococcus faecalis]|uniref:hypothetical protein n=1 Tax=Enterococcus TaxID=1350 RepID=UPI000353458D|nr:hypothetical protein [Enterococcus faecalis]EGO5846225.1 hypothetical protein [Enterococcus faecalis]EPH81438.1 hypothetical protein D924_02614 [Enterococcus faecalis 06-MB-S-10]EPH87568.1 hypothetical protein D923_02444 [Enterococcus faecalis 06-MB-S-04]EPH88417.1 hypothetical protein D921_02911 [Enterococcus faecalis F01966]MCU2242701.1 hypothetical protein [Enterococcus faecalis]